MTKTTNYQLNQWAKPDRVMMDDFNADNAKIDAALKANGGGLRQLPHRIRQLCRKRSIRQQQSENTDV